VNNLTIYFITIHNGTVSKLSILNHATKQAFIFKCYPLAIIIIIITRIIIVIIIMMIITKIIMIIMIIK